MPVHSHVFVCRAMYLYLIVPFWYASAAYQASLVEPWFVFWRDVVEPKYPWWDQTSLICCRSVPKKVRLGIYRTQIRPKTRCFFFSYRDQSGVVERHGFTLFWSSVLFSNSSSAILFNSFVWSFIFWILEVQVKKEIWKIRLHFETKKVSALSVKFTRAPASVAASNFGAKLYFFPLSYR